MKKILNLFTYFGIPISTLYRLAYQNECGFGYARFLRRWGNFCHIGPGCYIATQSRIEAPEMVIIGEQVKLGACTLIAGDGFLDYSLVNRPEDAIVIGSFATVEDGAKIYPGVTIGAHAKIMPGAVITTDVGDHAVVYGDDESPSNGANVFQLIPPFHTVVTMPRQSLRGL